MKERNVNWLRFFYRAASLFIIVGMLGVIILNLAFDDSSALRTAVAVFFVFAALVLLSIPFAMYLTGYAFVLTNGTISRDENPRRFWGNFAIIVILDAVIIVLLVSGLY